VAAGRPSASASTGNGQTLPSTLASPAGSAASAGTSDGSVAAGSESVPASGNPVPASGGTVPVRPSAAQQASAEQVAAFLGTYFEAINDRDYLAYIRLFE
jgi:hypothetical protein